MRTFLASTLIALVLFVAPSWANETAVHDAPGMAVDYDQPVDRLFEATIHALAVLKIPVERREADAYRANITARQATGSARLMVGIVRTGETSCRVMVASSDHDEALPPLLHEKIAAALR